jgi:hypothetical protein
MSKADGQVTWVKSSLSISNGQCVQVAGYGNGDVGVKNSRGGPALRFTSQEWQAFVHGVRNGEFDDFGAVNPQ